MDYLDIGFSQFLTKNAPSSNQQELDPLQFEVLTQQIPGEKITGSLESLNKKLKIDMDNQLLSFNDGNIPRVELGNTKHGAGLIVYDKQGAIIFESTEVI